MLVAVSRQRSVLSVSCALSASLVFLATMASEAANPEAKTLLAGDSALLPALHAQCLASTCVSACAQCGVESAAKSPRPRSVLAATQSRLLLLLGRLVDVEDCCPGRASGL